MLHSVVAACGSTGSAGRAPRRGLAGKFRKEATQRGHRRIDADAGEVAVVVERPAIFALVAVFHAVFVHEWDGQNFDLRLKPTAQFGGIQRGVEHSFEHETGGGFAGVLAYRSEVRKPGFPSIFPWRATVRSCGLFAIHTACPSKDARRRRAFSKTGADSFLCSAECRMRSGSLRRPARTCSGNSGRRRT